MANNPPYGSRPYGGGNRPHHHHGHSNQVRKNERIRAREIRLIDPDGKLIGIVSRDEGLDWARRYGLDLVEIAATAQPPVCKILDYGKYMYELSKKSKEKHPTIKVKIIKFRAHIGDHDFMVKLRHSEEFLFKGNKLRFVLQFRGREMEHTEIGMAVVQRAVKELVHVGVLDGEVKRAGRNIFANMSPLPQAKRKLKFNEQVSEGDNLKDDADEVEHDDEHDSDGKH